jgi:hypothetical protein
MEERGAKITADIIDLVMKDIEKHGGEIDFEAIMRGIGCSYASLAYTFQLPEQAKAFLVELADQLDDRQLLEWAKTAEPGSGLPPALLKKQKKPKS